MESKFEIILELYIPISDTIRAYEEPHTDLFGEGLHWNISQSFRNESISELMIHIVGDIRND